MSRQSLLLSLGLALALGIAVRIPYLTIGDFPLNDGGLFVAAVDAIVGGSFHLPLAIDYNGWSLPFVYPPLGLYIAAFASEFTGLSITDVLRYLPLAENLATISAFVLLGSRLLADDRQLLYASIFFPLTIRSYEWLIMGGGITRSLGCLLCLLAAYVAAGAVHRTRFWSAAAAGVWVGLAALTHLEWGITAALSVVLVTGFSRVADKKILGIWAVAGATALTLVTPWLVMNVTRHGVAPYLSASGSAEWSLVELGVDLATLEIATRAGFYLAWLVLLGALVCLRKRAFLLPSWFLLILLSTPRHGPTAVTIPAAMLCAYPMLSLEKRVASWISGIPIPTAFRRLTDEQTDTVASLSVVVTAVVLLFSVNRSYYGSGWVTSLGEDERNAMVWIRDNTPAGARFVLLSNAVNWEKDAANEWFPVLAHRQSLTTVQGREWLPDRAFSVAVAQDETLRLLQTQATPTAVWDFVLAEYGRPDYVVVFDVGQLETTITGSDGGYALDYRLGSVVVYRNTSLDVPAYGEHR